MSVSWVADLHNHSTASDGDFTPAEVVRRISAAGIKAMALTDHDTLAGLDEAAGAAGESGIEFIPGVEVSVRFSEPFFKGTLHVLCYFSPGRLNRPGFRETARELLTGGRGEKLLESRVRKLNRAFGPEGVSPVLKRRFRVREAASYGANVSRRHFALALKEKHGISDEKTILSLIGNDSPAYLPSGLDLESAGCLFRQEGVVAVLAHPAAGSFPGKGHYREVLPGIETVEALLPAVIQAGVRGVEAVYPGHTGAHEQRVRSWAEKWGLVITGGSDHHDGVNRPVGAAGITQSEFNQLKKLLT